LNKKIIKLSIWNNPNHNFLTNFWNHEEPIKNYKIWTKKMKSVKSRWQLCFLNFIYGSSFHFHFSRINRQFFCVFSSLGLFICFVHMFKWFLNLPLYKFYFHFLWVIFSKGKLEEKRRKVKINWKKIKF
jgi:hypothetical protein